MRPRLRSYGVISTWTLSPGRMRIRCIRILPELCASTLWPFSSSTRNMALGNGSTTVPSSTMASSFGFGRSVLLCLWLDPGHGAARSKTRSWALVRRTYTQGGGPNKECTVSRRNCHPTWAPSAQDREDLRSVLGNGDRVLKVGREAPIGRDDAPLVV